MIETAVVAGLAATWPWVVINDDQGVAAPLTRLLRKHPVSQKWMECPWCSGAWFAGAAVVALRRGSVAETAATAVAAATITGLLGSYLEG